MLRHLYLFSFIVVLLISCNMNSKHLVSNIEIENKELKQAILEYDSIIRHEPKLLADISNSSYLLTVYEKNVNDSVTKFAITFSLDTWLMQEEPIWLADVGGKTVVFYPSNTYRGILSTNKKLHKEISQSYFPKEYKLLAKGKKLNDFVTNDSPSLVLTFVREKLVAKRMSRGI